LAASDQSAADGGDQRVHDASRDIRDHSAHERRRANQQRSEAVVSRDSAAHSRDLAAEARDLAAAALDHDLEAGDGERARARAAADRVAAACDRAQAADDRREAEEDRKALQNQLAASETDALTGTRARAPGLADLDNEIDRARRTEGLLSIAYVDVVGLKAVNDTRGYSAGDALLRDAVRVIRVHLRSYDAIVRVGGDEFLCVMSGAPIQDARRRFEAIQESLEDDPSSCEIKFGLSSLAADDSAAQLIDRADAALPRSRG
jgi:diguanylate cyclase (GGDEF)-like protein